MSDPTEFDLFSLHDMVQEPLVDAQIEAKKIGGKLRRLRLRRSMGLVELSESVGLSASYLSQLETGKVVPTLRNLSRIAIVHKVDLSYFFSESKSATFKTSRARDRIRIPLGPKDSPYALTQSMSALIPSRTLVPCIAELRPGMDHLGFDARPFHGTEFAYVMEGSVTLESVGRSEVLDQGDVVWVDGSEKRNYKCVSRTVAKVMLISLPLQR